MPGIRAMLAMLAVCGISCMGPADDGNDDPSDPGGFSGHGGCQRDSACSPGQLCTRSGACLPPSEVRAVHVTWTLKGQPADANTCSAQPSLSINIHARSDRERDRVSYAPVPCVAGKFTVDKLPRSFDQVELGRTRADDARRSATIDTSGEATIDLPF